MASSCCCSALLLPSMASRPNPSLSSCPIWVNSNPKIRKMHSSFIIKAAKLPAGLVVPKVEPKFSPPFAGFTRIAETWNSRACMIGLIGTFIVELILNKGILQLIGVEIGKGLDIPL